MKLRLCTLAVFLLLWAAPAFSQGCAMCYSSAKGTSKEGQKAISRGVLVLLLPPLAFMTLGAGMAVRYSKKRDEEQYPEVDSLRRTVPIHVGSGSPTRPRAEQSGSAERFSARRHSAAPALRPLPYNRKIRQSLLKPSEHPRQGAKRLRRVLS